MKKISVMCVLFVFFLAACEKPTSPPRTESETLPVSKAVLEKGNVSQDQPLPPEVKIKLKKDGKDHYSWELSGSDADQILKVNRQLEKGLIETGK